MVLVMDRDGSLSPSYSQQSFSRTYKDGVGQGSVDAGLRILDDAAAQAGTLRAPKRPRPPHADILAAIEGTALRYAGHQGPRAARITATGWLNLYRANIEIESGYDPDAVSPAGAIGLGQLMPGTADLLGVDPHDWRQNLDGSARYLAWMLAEFGDMRLALAAYNAGPDAVRAHSGIPPFRETRNHVQRVLEVFTRLEGAPL